MTLNEFIAKSHAEVDDFRANWKDEHDLDPKQWPLRMAESDWKAQLSEYKDI